MINNGIMSQTIKQEGGSPSMASDALDYIVPPSEDSNSLDPNTLLFDLNELLKKDPTLSSLDPAKIETDHILDNSVGGMPIPLGLNNKRSPLHMPGQVTAGFAGDIDDTASSLGAGAAGSVGAHGAFGSSVGSNVTASPLLASPPPAGTPIFTGAIVRNIQGVPVVPMQVQQQSQQPTVATAIPPHIQNIKHPLPLQSMDTTPPPNTTIVSGTADLNLDLDCNNEGYFTNAASRNVSLCPEDQQQQKLRQQQQQALAGLAIKQEPGLGQQQSQQQLTRGVGPTSNTTAHFLNTEDSLLFSSTSFGGQSGGATFTSPSISGGSAIVGPASKDILSSSVPATILNSPLSDILADLSPSGAGAGGKRISSSS